MWIPIDIYSDNDVALLPRSRLRWRIRHRKVRDDGADIHAWGGGVFVARSPLGGKPFERPVFDFEGRLPQGRDCEAPARCARGARDSADRLVRVGCSVRLVVGVTVKSGSFGLSLPAIAAAMELQQAEAFYKVTWAGLDLTKVGGSLAKIKQGPEPLSVENYHALS